MKREQAKSMKELMALFIEEAGLGPGLDQERVSSLWDQLLGPSIASATLQKQLRDGKLYVRLRSSVVRNYLFMEQKSIMAKLNDAMGKSLVTELILY